MAKGDQAISTNLSHSTPDSFFPPAVLSDYNKYYEETGKLAYAPWKASLGRGSSPTSANYSGKEYAEFVNWATNRTVKAEDSISLKHAAYRRSYPYSYRRPGITGYGAGWFPVDGYDKFVEDTQEALDALDPDDNRYEDANPGVGTGDTGFGGTGGSGGSGSFTEQELIDAALDPTKTIVRDENGNVISIDDAVDPNTVTSTGGDALDAIGDSVSDGPLGGLFGGGSNLGPPPGAPTLGGTLGEVTNGTGEGDLGIIDNGGVIFDPDASNENPVTTIDENLNNDSNIDFTGNGESGTGGGGTLEEVASPGFEIIGNIIYDADGNIIGTTGETAPGIAPVVGGASDTNPVFDEITAEQQFELDRQAEAVALLDSGVGRYNAAIRKMGIIGRQGEEYAPLILDQLRMAEQEAAQPQFAAFGFGQNDMLGGMPQIGVQGVQGNVGGQSALSALSNAGLNQLNVGRQNYNRIALPSVGADGMPISQINNPTIFKASTNV